MELNPNAGSIIGIEIGVDFISLLLADFAAHILWRHHERTGRRDSQATILNLVAENIQIAVAQAKRHGLPILGLALGVPGLVDVESGTLLYAPNLKWHQVPLRQFLTQRFDLPIYVDNEASIAAFGETYFGAARGTTNMVFIHAGVGIGIANLVNALNPEMVVLGGPLSLAKDYLRPSIQATLHERAFRWSAQAT